MIRVRTGYSFRQAAGKLDDVISRLKDIGAAAAPITDRASTFGFYRWSKLCAENNIKPVFGVELAVSKDIHAKKPSADHWVFIAKGSVAPINRLIELATTQFRYQPLLTLEQALEAEGVFKITGNKPPLDLENGPEADVFIGLGPSTPKAVAVRAAAAGWPLAATSDNRYARAEDRGFYEVLTGRNAQTQTYAQHILSESEWRKAVARFNLSGGLLDEALRNSEQILEQSNAELQTASLPHPERPDTLENLCLAGAAELGVDLSDKTYEERLKKELDLIEAKGYEDYFYIVADICQYAREKMIVGPARGSSCGSLVCYLLKITTIDPIPHGLIFERFIDINRDDMPDIDIDFSDQQRHFVFSYIEQKYGKENVARLGTVAMFKPRSALQEAGAALRIPRWKCEKVADTLIERSSGDSRALDTLLDTFETMPAGQELLKEYPEAAVMTRFEGHPRHYSQHAAGVVVADKPITEFVAIDHRTGATMCDKKDAEDGYNLLKIDALGLTQLSIFEDTLEMAGLSISDLEGVPLDSQEAFEVLNAGHWSGIFQFNGIALQSLTKQTKVDCFEDIVAITALARPGPLTSGGATEWIKRKNGDAKVTFPHPLFEPYMNDTLGVVMFQEQVMEIGRNIGDLTWADVTALRKAMSKSLGKEYFDQFGDRWKEAAAAKGIDRELLDKVWDDLCAYGAWAFNKSHSVAYGLISYWCCWLKSHHPFEFAAATLSHEKDPSKQIAILREMVEEGYSYLPVDAETSSYKWGIANRGGKKCLVGPLTSVKGIGPKLAQQVVAARARGEPIPERANKLLTNPKTPIDSLYPIDDRIKVLLPDPLERNIITPRTLIGDITEEHTEETKFLIIGTAKTINPRDENETIMIARRGYKLKNGPLMSLNLQMEDDSGIIYCKINRFKYEQFGKQIVDRGRAGKSVYAVKGSAMAGRRFLMVNSVKYLGDMDD